MTWEVGKTYPMRGGGEFRVLEIFDGKIYGRRRTPNREWLASERLLDGRTASASSVNHDYDLMPPTPPVVVSDAARDEFYRSGVYAIGGDYRSGIAAAITAWLTEHPHMLRAWQEGPK